MQDRRYSGVAVNAQRAKRTEADHHPSLLPICYTPGHEERC